MIDILLNEDYQPVSNLKNDVDTVSDFSCVIQDIKLEAVTTEGELFYDTEYGWSLLDFINSENAEIDVIEIKQRIRDKLKKRDYIDVSSLDVQVKFENDIVVINTSFKFINGNRTENIEIVLNKLNIEVTINDK